MVEEKITSPAKTTLALAPLIFLAPSLAGVVASLVARTIRDQQTHDRDGPTRVQDRRDDD